jgi:hypothetical protein
MDWGVDETVVPDVWLSDFWTFSLEILAPDVVGTDEMFIPAVD